MHGRTPPAAKVARIRSGGEVGVTQRRLMRLTHDMRKCSDAIAVLYAVEGYKGETHAPDDASKMASRRSGSAAIHSSCLRLQPYHDFILCILWPIFFVHRVTSVHTVNNRFGCSWSRRLFWSSKPAHRCVLRTWLCGRLEFPEIHAFAFSFFLSFRPKQQCPSGTKGRVADDLE